MLGFLTVSKKLKALQDRTPLGLLQLKHDRVRLLTAIAGITFADVLIFLQLGFADALFKSNTQYPRAIQADLIVLSTQAKNFSKPRTFPSRRLYQALDVPGVATTDEINTGSKEWRNPQTREKSSLLIVGQNPDRPAFNLPEINQQLDRTRLPDTFLFDKAARGDYRQLIEAVEQTGSAQTEIGVRTVTVTGVFTVGASFGDDGALITSNQNFFRQFPKRERGTVNLGLINVEPGYDIASVQADLRHHLPDDVQILTHESYLDLEVNEIQSNSPISVIFNIGSAMGFIVGIVIVYQVLSTDVNSHLSEYATFKAMGYRNGYLLSIVFEEAIILSVLGFIPSFGMGIAIYRLAASATALPMAMTTGRAVAVLVLTVVMCGASGAIATQKLQSADPADIFS
ncbi:MAG: ABC transporter permease DevC [Cyanobacteria bacterium P01_A01_bin.116]